MLIVAGAFIEMGYKNPLYFYWLIVLILLVLSIEVLIDLYTNKVHELKESDNKVSTMLILKGNSSNVLQIAFFPREKVIANKEIQIDLFITCAIPIKVRPDVKLITKANWKVKISNQLQREVHYAGDYEYILKQSLVSIKEERFINYRFFVTFEEAGKYDFIVECSNSEVNGILESSIVAHSD